MADFPNPSPEPPPLPLVAESPQPISEATGLPRNVAAGLACIFILVGGIVFLVLERKDRFVRFYAVQSILLGSIALLVSIATEVVQFIFSQIPLLGKLLNGGLWLLNGAFFLTVFVIYVVLIIKAFMGKEWEIPYLGRIARKQTGGRIS
ncbi:MAG: hypothetical protein EOP84_02195 [Verrucomicrobiaceae bacterium]|nr:MAG: hypothetical protein EOP84_02195 [Verrucomicrobiaceae bacterium]